MSALVLAMLGGGCSWGPKTADAPVLPLMLYGEVHDNAHHHARRLEHLRALVARGARPTLLFEPFDLERQADIDRARAAGADAQALIDAAAAPGAGWPWPLLRPLVALALQHDLPIVAANVSRAQARRVMAEGLAAQGFVADVPADIGRAQAALIEASHCGLVDAPTAQRMALAQVARDQAMARLLQQHAARGVVLVAGNGHVRRDIGVPRWLGAPLQGRVEVVGQVESAADAPPGAFDRTVVTPPQPREDPCAAMKQRRSSAP
jgi:uncharacterized iron-regulated protein